jgi:hypothetical protein
MTVSRSSYGWPVDLRSLSPGGTGSLTALVTTAIARVNVSRRIVFDGDLTFLTVTLSGKASTVVCSLRFPLQIEVPRRIVTAEAVAWLRAFGKAI